MFQFAIIEKSDAIMEDITREIKKTDIMHELSLFHSVDEFMDQIDENRDFFDILYINISIDEEEDGLKLAQQIRENDYMVAICLISDTERYYRQAFRVFSSCYIVYPNDLKDIRPHLNHVCYRSIQERTRTWKVKEAGGLYRTIYFRHIMHVESENHTITIHLSNGEDIVSYQRINDIERKFPAGYFARCHQSHMINYHFVDAINSQSIFVNGCYIPISRRYRKSINVTYNKFIASMKDKN